MSRRWLAALGSLAVATVFSGLIGALAATECPGEFGKFGAAMTFVLFIVVAGVIAVAGLVSLVLQRIDAGLVLVAAGLGLVIGFWLGATAQPLPSRCSPVEPDRVAETGGTAVVTLGTPYNRSLTGGVDCTVEIATGRAVGIQGILTDPSDGFGVQLFGVPTMASASGDYSGLDVIVVDGSRVAPGYRPTSAEQVTADPVNALSGRITLVDVPLLEDTRSSPETPDHLDTSIEWHCRPLAGQPQ